MSRIPVIAPNATAVGPYSPGIRTGDTVYLSGQTPLDPATGRLVEGGIDTQAHQCLRNLGAILKSAGLDFDDVVKCNVFLTEMNDFAVMNRVYAGYFSEPYPARTTIGVAALPLGARIEIEMVAAVPRP
ncbi:2-iminobutanoate/2-iminopropanoate deaminase [Methylobacterium phyllostachyos]|uniref:2-iminobutanoate/2-iminopropanoate deaminase n=1 Tax=Methylobacterium phyllostachyos TaxID=582672 RepID=A0A1G9YA87_9HYPH|nr:RidA family protein [Methylobacterium phyllostachyos]SDN05431.1 2-iminobutanoate/2-iminopropanoate deaminase [Methylobacterium phyllostachyos]